MQITILRVSFNSVVVPWLLNLSGVKTSMEFYAGNLIAKLDLLYKRQDDDYYAHRPANYYWSAVVFHR